MQKGENLKTLSEDLTTTTNKGNVPFGTLTTISESPKKFGLLYVGTDDGHVWRSKDIGYTWNKVSTKLPQGLWISRVIASEHIEGRVYASLNGYRNDDFTPYLFVSNNHGESWQQITTGLPQEPINVIKEDPKMESIIYVGSDNGLYVSINNGKSYSPWRGGLPRVAVHDIAIQKRDNEIVLGTHGRSVFISSLELVQKLPEYENKNLAILPISKKNHSSQLGKKWSSFAKPYSYELPIQIFTQIGGECEMRILSKRKKLLYNKIFSTAKGWNSINYDLSISDGLQKNIRADVEPADDENFYLPIGEYIIEIENAAEKVSTELELVEKD